MDLEPTCFGVMPSNPQPSHRNPLALLSKFKRQLSKSPSRRQQPIEHQYLPIPTISFSDSLHSHHPQSTYSCSNISSSDSSFVLIDHNEGPASFAVDEYTPFLPLIIQHERLQQRLAATHSNPPPPPPPMLKTQSQRGRLSPHNEPPSPTSSASSKSPITPPIFVSSFFSTDNLDLDEIMSLSSSEVASISEYSLPRSLSAYMQQGRSISRKSSSVSISESEYRPGRGRGMSFQAPPSPPPSNLTQKRQPYRYPSRKSFSPAPSPPPSCPLPAPPVKRVIRSEPIASTSARPDSEILIGDGSPIVPDAKAGSSKIHNTSEDPLVVSSTTGGQTQSRAGSVSAIVEQLATSTSVQVQVPVLASICAHSKTIPSNIELTHSTSMSTSTCASSFPSTSTTAPYHELSTSSNEKAHDENDDDDDVTKSVSDTSVSTPTTPTQYGVGRQVVSGSGRDFGELGAGSKRSSKRSSKKESGTERKDCRSSLPAESLKPEGVKYVKNVEDGEKLKTVPVETDDVRLDSDSEVIPIQYQNQSPSPRRRDDTNPTIIPINIDTNTSPRQTHLEKLRERPNPEWTLFLGVPRNAPPPVPTVLPINPVSPITLVVEPNPSHAAVPNIAHTPLPTSASALLHSTTKERNRTLSPTYLPPTMITTMTNTTLNRTKSDSALLASAASATSVSDGTQSAGDEDKKKAKTKTKAKAKRKGGGEDWTLSLPLAMSPTPLSSSASAFRGGERGRESRYLETPSMVSGLGSMQAIVAGVGEECEREINGEVGEDGTGPVITVEDVDRQRRQHRGGSRRSGEDEKRDDGEEDEEERENENSLTLRVPRIVRSCSSSPLLSTSNHSRMKKGSASWMGATSTPNLRARGVERSSSSTLEEEVMFMLLGDTGNDENVSDTAQEDESSKARSKSRKDLANAMVLAQKKMAILDEDLARFNALLRNGNSGESQPSSTVTETTAAVTTKPKTVTLNSNPMPASTPSTPQKSIVASQTPIKPVLKHAKSCEPFLESHAGVAGVVVPAQNPVMRFPSSTGKGDLNFFDELGSELEPTTANLRLTKSAEWRMGDVNLLSTTLTSNTLVSSLPPAPIPFTSSSSSPSSPSSSSRASPPPPQRTTRISTSSTSSCTPTLLLPFSSTPSSSSASSSVNHSTKASPPSAFNSKSKGCLFPSGVGVEMSGARKSAPEPLRTSSFRAVSLGSLRTSTTPVEDIAPSHKSQKEKPGPPKHLPRLHSSSFSSSPSPSSSSKHHISYNRRSISPPPSPIPSESSSTLPTPLASAFPLPPSSIRMTEFGGVVAFQQKLKEFECARKKHLQQQQQQQRNQQHRSYRPPSNASSVASLISNASSTATVVPSGEQQKRLRGIRTTTTTTRRESMGDRRVSSDGIVAVATVAATPPAKSSSSLENGRFIEEDDEDSMYSGTYYSARSSFSS